MSQSENEKDIMKLYEKLDDQTKETMIEMFDLYSKLSYQQKETFLEKPKEDIWRFKCRKIDQYVVRDTKERYDKVYDVLPKVLINIVIEYIQPLITCFNHSWKNGGDHELEMETNFGFLFIKCDFHWPDEQEKSENYYEWKNSYIDKFYGNRMKFISYVSEIEKIELDKEKLLES